MKTSKEDCSRRVDAFSSSMTIWEEAISRKGKGDWVKAYALFQDCLEADTYPRSTTLWNLAICATGCGDGTLAAKHWRELGFPVAEPSSHQQAPSSPWTKGGAAFSPESSASGDGKHSGASLPFVAGLEPAALRIGGDSNDGSATVEVVPMSPISPCHGVVRAPTLRSDALSFGDIVLFDATPAGMWTTESRQEVPIFWPLGLMRKGNEHTFAFLAQYPAEEAAMFASFCRDVAGVSPGDVSQRDDLTNLMCRWFHGDRDRSETQQPAADGKTRQYGKIVVEKASDLDEVGKRITAALRRYPRVLVACPRLFEALRNTKLAGVHHKCWGSIERNRFAKH